MRKITSIIFAIVATLCFYSCDKTTDQDKIKDLSYIECYDSMKVLETQFQDMKPKYLQEGLPEDSLYTTIEAQKIRQLTSVFKNSVLSDSVLKKNILNNLKSLAKCPSTVVIDSIKYSEFYVASETTSLDTFIIYDNYGKRDTVGLYLWEGVYKKYHKKIASRAVPRITREKEHLELTVYWTANNSYNAPIASKDYFCMNKYTILSSGAEYKRSIEAVLEMSDTTHDWDKAQDLD